MWGPTSRAPTSPMPLADVAAASPGRRRGIGEAAAPGREPPDAEAPRGEAGRRAQHAPSPPPGQARPGTPGQRRAGGRGVHAAPGHGAGLFRGGGRAPRQDRGRRDRGEALAFTFVALRDSQPASQTKPAGPAFWVPAVSAAPYSRSLRSQIVKLSCLFHPLALCTFLSFRASCQPSPRSPRCRRQGGAPPSPSLPPVSSPQWPHGPRTSRIDSRCSIPQYVQRSLGLPGPLFSSRGGRGEAAAGSPRSPRSAPAPSSAKPLHLVIRSGAAGPIPSRPTPPVTTPPPPRSRTRAGGRMGRMGSLEGEGPVTEGARSSCARASCQSVTRSSRRVPVGNRTAQTITDTSAIVDSQETRAGGRGMF
ncbi:unnamed protein product [Prorocentrum cordatum]|uniref:Uncharacterized protein n=1 Tax=Prorocentrum cordatum TaxID=2364126 RepID=A0ABN9T3W4_9DINO|nr:unnamed protein product [Polarella glacialis]